LFSLSRHLKQALAINVEQARRFLAPQEAKQNFVDLVLVRRTQAVPSLVVIVLMARPPLLG
jgi:hypothetical protein